MLRRTAVACLLLLVFPLVTLTAQTPGVPLTGQLLSTAGRAVAGAEVTLVPPSGAPTATLTDAEGRFAFDPVEPGSYHVTAVAVGLSPVTEYVALTAGRPIELTIVLPEIVRERVNVVGYVGKRERIPGATTVIDAQEMERLKLATDDVHQMLRQVPGVYLQEEEGYGLRPNIGIRGTGTDRSGKITMMEDGVLIAPAPYAAPAAYYAPVPGRMEALEVRKGSSQIKYGPMTTGGVLNYVSTSIPSDLQVRGTMTAGGHETRKLTANVGDSYANFGWLVETFQLGNGGFKQLDGGGRTGVDLENYMAKLRFNTTPTPTLYQELEVKLGRTDQLGDETYLGLTDADFRRTPLRRYAASQLDVLDSSHQQYQVRHFLARRTWDLTTSVYRNNFRRSWYKLQTVHGSGLAAVLQAPESYPAHMAALTGSDTGPHALVLRDNNRTYYGAGVQSVLATSVARGGARHQIEAGVRYHQDEEDRFQQDDAYQMLGGRMILTRPGDPGSQANQIGRARAVAGFLSNSITWGRWSVSPGLRYEHIDLTRITYAATDPGRTGGTAVAPTTVRAIIPGAGASYSARPGVTVFGGVHRGFAPPGPGATDGTQVERSINYELGTRAQGGTRSAEVVAFFNDYGNLLGRDSVAAGGVGDGKLFNGGTARAYGLEAAAAWDAASALGLLSALPVRLAYTFTHAEFRNTFQSQFGPWGNVRTGDQLPYLPRHQVYASVETDHRSWRVRLETFYVGRMRTVAGQGPLAAGQATDAYLVVNVSGERQLTGRAALFAGVQNLTDNSYIVARHPAGVRPGLPRYMQAGLKIGLDR